MTSYYASEPQSLRLSVSAVVRREALGPELLLMRRSDNAHWGLPGGYMELGESTRAAVVREVREETGIRIQVGRLIGVYSEPAHQVIAYPNGDRVQAINLCFEGLAVGEGEIETPEETLETGFFRFDELPDPFVPIHEMRIQDALECVGEACVR